MANGGDGRSARVLPGQTIFLFKTESLCSSDTVPWDHLTCGNDEG